jgi:hypothetical protein
MRTTMDMRTARRYAAGATTLITPMHALPTAITVLSGLSAASLSERAHGTVGAGVMPVITVVRTTGMAGMVTATVAALMATAAEIADTAFTVADSMVGALPTLAAAG